MKQFTQSLTVATQGRGLYDITAEVAGWAAQQGIRTGMLTIFIRHTSASLTIQENADPAVLEDLEAFFARLVPEDQNLYRHRQEGPDDMPAHIRSALLPVQLTIPVMDGRLTLGTWQGIYVYEHRAHPHRRSAVLHLTGE